MAEPYSKQEQEEVIAVLRRGEGLAPRLVDRLEATLTDLRRQLECIDAGNELMDAEADAFLPEYARQLREENGILRGNMPPGTLRHLIASGRIEKART